jgi:hypothetical protein
MSRTVTIRELWWIAAASAAIGIGGMIAGAWGFDTALPATYFTVMTAVVATIISK